MKAGKDGKTRCFGNGDTLYARYHDTEWGVPVFDDRKLFEMLILEGAQAGLAWITILRKRDGYRSAFHQFDVERVAKMQDSALEALCQFKGIIRNRLKIFATRQNARVFLQIQKEFDSFSKYLWAYVHNKSIINRWDSLQDVPVTTNISDALSKDLKKRGMHFVGSTIVYAYMQSVGLVDDHVQGCWCYARKSRGNATKPQ